MRFVSWLRPIFGGMRLLRTKLVATFVSLIMFFLLLALYNYIQVDHIKQRLNHQNEMKDRETLVMQFKEAVQDLNVLSSEILISKNTAVSDRFQAASVRYKELLARIGQTASTNEQIAWRSQLIVASNDFLETFDTAFGVIKNQNLNAVDVTKNMEALFQQAQKSKDRIFTIVEQFQTTFSASYDGARSDTNKLLNKTVIWMLAAAVFVVLLSVAVSVLLVRSFTRPIQRMQRTMALIAEGDLTQRIRSTARDELGRLALGFDDMLSRMQSTLGRTKSIADHLQDNAYSFEKFSNTTAEANQSVLVALKEISVGASCQAEQMETSMALIHELSAGMGDIHNYAQNMAITSSIASRNAQSGTRAVESLQQSSVITEQSVIGVADAMHRLADYSGTIGKITDSITDISNQTNVLALNAAIEAARAGVHGKGFGVIAEEVRMLSLQTKESAQQIGSMIHSLQEQIAQTERHVNTAQSSFHEQSGKVAETQNAFVNIFATIEQLAQQMGHIVARTEQVLSRNQTLVESAESVVSIAQQTAAGVEEITATSLDQDNAVQRIAEEAGDIRVSAEKLFSEINRFTIGNE